MTPNDAQIDVLLRRNSQKTESRSASELAGLKPNIEGHLDADELNAFAEGALSSAARARYVSHLADCDHCRQLATQLTLAAGRSVSADGESMATARARISFLESLRNLFAPRKLRYTAFALVAIAAVGITFVALRRRAEDRASTLIAQNDEAAPARGSALKTDDGTHSQNQPIDNPQLSTAAPAPQNANVARQQPSQPGSADKASTAIAQPTAESGVARNVYSRENKKTENEVAQAAPSYAPPPPGERNEPVPMEEKRLKDLRTAAPEQPAPKSAAGAFKVMERGVTGGEGARARETETDRARSGASMAKEKQETEARSRSVRSESSTARRVARDKSASDSQDQSRNQGLASTVSEAAPEERKAGGHTFRKQGGAWVDVKLKSSMPVITVARGSEAFREMDSSVRAIASQFSGEVLIVHKGKVYRIP